MLQKRYKGFLNTPCLWHNNSVHGLKQFEISSLHHKIDISIDETIRLGKYVERLISFELRQQDAIKVVAENIQIQKNNGTLGELDCLLLKDDKPIHLEIIYKFYLYDTSIGASEIEHFIGPNRKDSLIEKLNKLKDKQLPLLYSDACQKYLDRFNLDAQDMTQQVYFKAQLFLPYNNKNTKLKTLNTDCIAGFYVNKNELNNFKDCKFFIPTKKDWLIEPYSNVDWLNFETFKETTKNYFEQKFSTLCWMKRNTGTIEKVFLVWW
ncbi:DUF1853 family protein [Hyunsoonleella flava]|uniref:DUF1853 family protein n=1 Tax=Hyunsoonleella flava TaxID=2527939 RepID=A0A4V2J9R9_9FLAO|nr:DUF1853 family protein [Hyunsoonleella flava]TBM99018.1 DUF1853 family protein [Hyunsoonleella flava]